MEIIKTAPPSIRKKVKERDGWKCTKCGSKEDLQIHHIKPTKYGIDNSLQNLLTLCRNCHRKFGVSPRWMSGKYKTINLKFTNEEFAKIKKLKGTLTWRDFLNLMTIHCAEAVKREDLTIG